MGQELELAPDEPHKSVKEILTEAWAYFYTLGMTYEQYWYEDIDLVKFYRRVDEIKRKRENEKCWLIGAYIYNAILCASPILHDFAPKGTKPMPYVKPFPITKEEMEARQRAEELERYNNFRNAMINKAKKK